MLMNTPNTRVIKIGLIILLVFLPFIATGQINKAESLNSETAVSMFSIAIQANPNNADLYLKRGVAYYSLGKKQQALDDYNKAIELNPTLATAFYSRGTAYYALGNMQSAFNDFNKTIELNPKDADAYYGRGNTYYAMGNLQQE